MSYYTFFLEYKGGTYIVQVEETCLELAIHSWAWALDRKFNLKLAKKILAQVKLDPPLPIQDMVDVWCCSFLFKKSLGLVHITRSSK